MPETPETLEGRVLAHRRVLAALLGRHPDLHDTLREMAEAPLHEEDPGAVPDPAFATEGALADEARRLLDLAAELAPGGNASSDPNDPSRSAASGAAGSQPKDPT